MSCAGRQLTQAELEAGFDQQRTGVTRAIRPFTGEATAENLADYLNREVFPVLKQARDKINEVYLPVVDNAPSANPLGYYFSTITANADPTSGFIRLDNATQDLATTIRVSQTNGRQADATPWLDVMSGSATSPLGVVTLSHAINPTRFIRFDLTSMTDQGAYWDLAVTPVESSHDNPFVQGDQVSIGFIAGVSSGVTVVAPGSAPAWSSVLAAGATSGASNPIVSVGQFLQLGAVGPAAGQIRSGDTTFRISGGDDIQVVAADGVAIQGAGTVSMASTAGTVTVQGSTAANLVAAAGNAVVTASADARVTASGDAQIAATSGVNIRAGSATVLAGDAGDVMVNASGGVGIRAGVSTATGATDGAVEVVASGAISLTPGSFVSIDTESFLRFTEEAASTPSMSAGQSLFWVISNARQNPKFTDDTNTDFDMVLGMNGTNITYSTSTGLFTVDDFPLTGLADQAAETFNGNFTAGLAPPTARAGSSVAGAGLTYTAGGTLAVGAGTGIVVNANDVAWNGTTTFVPDGDKGHIVVSASGATWLWDTTVSITGSQIVTATTNFTLGADGDLLLNGISGTALEALATPSTGVQLGDVVINAAGGIAIQAGGTAVTAVSGNQVVIGGSDLIATMTGDVSLSATDDMTLNPTDDLVLQTNSTTRARFNAAGDVDWENGLDFDVTGTVAIDSSGTMTLTGATSVTVDSSNLLTLIGDQGISMINTAGDMTVSSAVTVQLDAGTDVLLNGANGNFHLESGETYRIGYAAVSVNTTAPTATNATTNLSCGGSFTVPADTWRAGSTYRFSCHYVFDESATPPTLTFELLIAGSVVESVVVTSAAASGTRYGSMVGVIRCQTTGAGGTVLCSLRGSNNHGSNADNINPGTTTTATDSINTTLDRSVEMRVRMTTAVSSNTLTVTEGFVERLF